MLLACRCSEFIVWSVFFDRHDRLTACPARRVKSASDCEHKTCLHLDVHVGFCRSERFGSACFASSIADAGLGCPSVHREHHGSSRTCRTCCPTSIGCCPDRCPISHYRDHDLVPVLKRHLLTTSSREQKQPRPALQTYAYSPPSLTRIHGA